MIEQPKRKSPNDHVEPRKVASGCQELLRESGRRVSETESLQLDQRLTKLMSSALPSCSSG